MSHSRASAQLRKSFASKVAVRDEHVTSSRSRLQTRLRRKRMARLERLFKATDTNGNGVLDACEFRALVPTDVVVHLGEDGVAALFRRLDTNATGVIEIEEMQPLMLEIQAIQVHMKGFRTAAESPSRASRRMGGRRASSLSGVTRRLSIIRSEHAVAEADRACSPPFCFMRETSRLAIALFTMTRWPPTPCHCGSRTSRRIRSESNEQ